MVGTRVGVYEITRLIGAGPLGDVYEARDTSLGRRVAIRMLPPGLTADPQRLARLQSAARAAMALEHPHIARLHDVGPDYLVMEFVEGFPPEAPLIEAKALVDAAQVLAALEAAHGAGITHGNLTLDNVLVTSGGVKVLDFGLGSADIATDIQAFGALLYETLTGTPANADRKALPNPRLEAIVARCLAPDPAQRFASAASIAREIDAARSRTGRRRTLALTAAALVVAIGGTFLYQRSSTPLLGPDNTIVIADFENQTSHAVFDTALHQALTFDLQQSPYFSVVNNEQVRQAARGPKEAGPVRIAGAVARQVCLRNGATATLEGDISPVGSTFLITVRAMDCRTGRRLALEQMGANSLQDVVAALASASAALRDTLGEPEPRAEHRIPTRSLEALEAFALGDARGPDAKAAIPYYERAIEIDPSFAMAWTNLGLRYAAAGDPAKAREHLRKARSLSAGVSDRERLYIDAVYQQLHGEPRKQRDALDALARRYPRDPLWHTSLSIVYARTGDWQRAADAGLAAVRTGPRLLAGYRLASAALIELDRVDDAKAVLRRAIAIGFDTPAEHESLFYLESAGSDEDAIARELTWFEQRMPGAPQPMRTVANRAAALGQYQRALDAYRATIARARQPGSPIPAARYAEEAAMMSAMFEDCARIGSRRPSVLVDALCGSGTAMDRVAAAQPPITTGPAAVARGMAMLRGGRAQEAAALFDDMLARRAANWGPEWPAAMVARARVAATLGDTAGARRHFEMLFEWWKNADQGIPLLVAARREHAALR